jgi:lipopolysaccharide transport system ATP-binding protein
MESDVVIKVDNLSKKFCRSIKRSMLYGSMDVARSMLGLSTDRTKLRKHEFWSLKDISFEVKKGETFGLVGANGSGKSTLLRMINGIFPPDVGSITVKGRIGALIAVGAGFHPHMTGRENIYLNGTVLGMAKEEIARKFDSIIEFAGIGEFLDAPVSTYSSGMYVRLGFAIAIHSDLDLLLVDEILAVGDINFQRKCFEKVLQLKAQGVSTIFVTHSIPQLERMCDRGLLLDHGVPICLDNIREVIKRYMAIEGEHELNKPLNTSKVGVECRNF